MRHIASGVAALALVPMSAQAADLPIADPVEYVQICDAYGTGYFFIPGTETCLRIRGRVRAEYRFNNFGDAPNDWDRRSENDTSTRARGYLRLDARTQTEYGMLRTYIDMFATVDTPGFASGDGTVVDRPSNDDDEGSFGSEGDTELELDYAFIQFGGLTVGKAQSFYDFWTGYTYGAITAVAYSDEKPWIAGYTADFGNGFSASISVEDRTYRDQDLFVGSYLNEDPDYSQNYGGHRFPELVGNFRVDQGWGSAQIMGAVREVRYLSSIPDGEVGFAIGGGVEVNIPYLGESQAALQATYADGALGYVHSDWGGDVFDASSVFPTGGVGSTLRGDGTGEGWSVAGGIITEWSPQFYSALELSYAEADNKLYWDVDQFDIQGVIGWTPVSGFEIGTEVGYRNIEYSSATAPNGVDPISSPRDQDIWTWLIRVQRDF
ncbi:porin [Pseudovibrio sp. SPO723]|uniref:porin n=1 Tax=Nesiotobacter zosterae TaxID=392721 RepID=UPI0029C1A68E|nr:porin [Pseudovibrio sp. SPO723]MDX5592982.1 porin [Pseudovibrio sp. SPO723]